MQPQGHWFPLASRAETHSLNGPRGRVFGTLQTTEYVLWGFTRLSGIRKLATRSAPARTLTATLLRSLSSMTWYFSLIGRPRRPSDGAG